MKAITSIFLFLVLLGYRTKSSYSVPSSEFRPEKEGSRYADSLLANGVDTLVSYENKIYLFDQYIVEYYIGWIDSGRHHTILFTNSREYRTECDHWLQSSIPFRHFDSLQKESLEEFIVTSSRNREFIRLKVGSRILTYDLSGDTRNAGELTLKVIFANQIRADIALLRNLPCNSYINPSKHR